MLPDLSLVIDPRWHKNAEWTKKWHTSRWLSHWCSYLILTSYVVYHWTDPCQHGIYLFYIFQKLATKLFVLYTKPHWIADLKNLILFLLKTESETEQKPKTKTVLKAKEGWYKNRRTDLKNGWSHKTKNPTAPLKQENQHTVQPTELMMNDHALRTNEFEKQTTQWTCFNPN